MSFKSLGILAAFAMLAATAAAQVKVEQAWARPTVPGQQGGGGFMTMQSPVADKLLGGRTAASARFELHTMALQGDVMKMREVKSIDLPAGEKVELKPGGLHVMFIGIKEPLALGSKVPVTLQFEKAGEVAVEFEVMSRPAGSHSSHKH